MQGHTYLRTHTLTAEHLRADLGDAARQLRAEIEPNHDRRAVTLVREHGLNLTLTFLRANAELREHAAPGPAMIQVLDGHAQVAIGDEHVDLPAGYVMAFDADLRHVVRAEEDSTLLITVVEPPSQDRT